MQIKHKLILVFGWMLLFAPSHAQQAGIDLGVTLAQTSSVLGYEFARQFGVQRAQNYPYSSSVVHLKERFLPKKGRILEISSGENRLFALSLGARDTLQQKKVHAVLERVEKKLLELQFSQLLTTSPVY